MMRLSDRWLRLQTGVFLILLGSFAYFWHSRDWNSASRLILTYALVDRGTLVLDGLEQQTGDIARFRGHYYCDKLPGFSLLATVPYSVVRLAFDLPPHPLHRPAMAHWPADYWVTLGTSGIATALAAVLLARIARRLGCPPRGAALLALAYGLATPAYVYATLAYGHQVAALAVLGSLWLLWEDPRPRAPARLAASGFLAAFAAAVELQLAPVSAILGLYLLLQCTTGIRRFDGLVWFALGGLVPTAALLVYNVLAFGSPWETGYFHHATPIFAQVHSRDHPLGLRPPDPALLVPLLLSRHRGLLFYAPILALAGPGWIRLCRRGHRGLAAVTLAIAAAVLLVNLSYPEWTGGWSTGPRLLVPLLPFALIAVAGALAGDGAWPRRAEGAASGLALAGALLMLLFQGAGGRLPQFVADPLFEVVLPLWSGTAPLPPWWTGERFPRNLASLVCGSTIEALPVCWQWLQFLPLALVQAAAISALLKAASNQSAADSTAGNARLTVALIESNTLTPQSE
jgi:hypothetical protein